MTDEPKRPIETELESWAKARRDDEGAPFELHPASRQMLQGEVARVLADPAGQPSVDDVEPGAGFWARWWRQLAVGATVAFAVVLVLVVYGPQRQEAEFQFTQAEALKDLEARAPFRDDTTRKAQEVMFRARQQTEAQSTVPALETASVTLAANSTPAPRSDGDVGGANVDTTVARSTVAMSVRSGANKPAETSSSETLLATVPPPSPADLPKLDGLAMEPAAKKLEIVEAPQAPATNQAIMSLDLAAAEIAAREVELAIVADALRKSNAEISRELEETRRMKLAAAPPKSANPADGDPNQVAMSFAAGASATQTTAPSPAAGATAARSGGRLGGETKPKNLQGSRTSQVPQTAADLSIRQEFSQSAGRPVFRRNFNSPPPATVLQTFTVENTGRAVRIVDQDGSVYTGALENEANQASNFTQFPFSAIGLNRTLDQQVRFNGLLEVSPEGHTRVRGRASVGIRTELEINARPAPQP